MKTREEGSTSMALFMELFVSCNAAWAVPKGNPRSLWRGGGYARRRRIRLCHGSVLNMMGCFISLPSSSEFNHSQGGSWPIRFCAQLFWSFNRWICAPISGVVTSASGSLPDCLHLHCMTLQHSYLFWISWLRPFSSLTCSRVSQLWKQLTLRPSSKLPPAVGSTAAPVNKASTPRSLLYASVLHLGPRTWT